MSTLLERLGLWVAAWSDSIDVGGRGGASAGFLTLRPAFCRWQNVLGHAIAVAISAMARADGGVLLDHPARLDSRLMWRTTHRLSAFRGAEWAAKSRGSCRPPRMVDCPRIHHLGALQPPLLRLWGLASRRRVARRGASRIMSAAKRARAA